MKSRIGICLSTALLACASVPALAQPAPAACLKDYDAPTAKVRAGFIPCKAEVVLGQPLQATFSVQNLGPTNFEFWFGGDYRETGRHDRFKIAVTNENGEALPDPIAHPMDFGGFVQQVNLKPGQFFTNVVWLTDFRVIDKPGVYTVTCSFAFDEHWRQKEMTNPVVNSTFPLTILERTPERVAQVLDELVAKAQTVHGNDLGAPMALIARFGKDDAVPRLDQLARSGSVELRTAAIGALPLIPTDASLKIALENFKDSDPEIRSAAANTLGTMQKPEGVEALLEELPKEPSPVAENIIRALGTSKFERAFPAITNALDVGEIEMQRAAIDALVNFGGSNAMAVLQQHINTNFLSLRYEIVLALAEKLHQPMQAEWLLPVLMGRENNTYSWGDSLGLLQRHAGEKAIPIMLSCLDFDVAWSERNHAILYAVKLCPNAPAFDDYIWETDLGGRPEYPNGSPQMWTNNLRTLQKLKALAGPIPTIPVRPLIPPPAYLKTDPPIDFTPTFQENNDGVVQIKSGFFTLAAWRHRQDYTEGNTFFTVSDSYRTLYQNSKRLRSLPNDGQRREELKITPEQSKQLDGLLHQFALELCNARVVDNKLGNFYQGLVFADNYTVPFDDDWDFLKRNYFESPPGPIREQAKADLMNSVQAFSQNYHAGTVEFVEGAKKIFTPAQLQEMLK
jgi:hypothetical protein